MTNVLADIKSILHDVVAKAESIDEGVVGVVEAAKVNPTAVSIINTAAGIAHLPDPDGLLAQADSLLKTFGNALARAAAATAPAADGEAQAAPVGPAVGGVA